MRCTLLGTVGLSQGSAFGVSEATISGGENNEENHSRVACVASALVASATAQNFSADDLARRMIERRAVEAVIWGMPAVNTDLMRQQMLTKTAGEPTRSSTGAGRSTRRTRR